ncbi:sorting nexin-25 [Stomoxys calcitrans]|uniref:sorting nexin-25 n=1 Tax=Stomoxys calcitrans TaxID=35570 RepID=UPI0027E25A8E|nr:sorting nexin-25 [Stomoxys calcitrans]
MKDNERKCPKLNSHSKKMPAIDAIENFPHQRPLFPLDHTPHENGGSSSHGSSKNSSTSSSSKLRTWSALLRVIQLNWKIFLSALAVTLLAIIWYYPIFFLFILFVLYSLLLVVAAVAGTVYIHYLFTTKEPPKPNREPLNVLYNATQNSLFDLPKPIKNATNLPLIFGKTVDLQIQQIIEYVLRDFMTPWLGYVVTKPKLMNDIVREDLWNAIQKMHERAKKMDAPKLIAVDMINRVTVHLEKIRISEARAAEMNVAPVFSTNSYLANEEKEMEFLRKLCEIMVILLLPRGYSLPPLKVLLSEILSYKIFFPMIKMLTSPDYINQKVVQNIEGRLAAAAISKRSYEYAASFEDFLKVINNCGNLEELSLIRKSIVNDLMHATTVQNLQRAKGIDPDNDPDHNLSKSEVSAAMRLKRYVAQLTYAKNMCEKNLEKFGWNGNYSSDLDLSLVEILNTAIGRRYFTIFLEPLKASALVGFYMAVEEMKHAPKNAAHQLGTEIFYTYIRVPKSEIQFDKHERKLIETFLLGDSGPEIFYDLQKQILKTLEEKYYPPFVLSEQYRLLKEALDSDDYKDPTLIIGSLSDNHEDVAVALDGLEVGATGTIDVAAHTSYARKKLEQIQERIDKKNQALDALKYSVKPDSKVLQILEKEMEWLKNVKRQTEAHLRRTDAWTEHLGRWKATLQSVEISDEKESLQFMILVHVDEDINTPPSLKHSSGRVEARPGSISSGWVVMRSLNQVHELQRKLRHVSANLKSFDLPTNFKFFFLKNDKHALEKAKLQIQKFINLILEDDHLNGSEAIYTFLSPSSDHLKQSLPSPKKSKFSLSTLFKTETGKSSESSSKASDPFWGLQRDDEDISTYLEGVPTGDNKLMADLDSKDSIAEPLYALMGEIFDMGGVFKWLRKSLISFVQITYGRTINRQIRESVSYLFEESMLHYYFSAILKSFWPGGVLASAYPVRSDDMKEMTTNAAKALLMDNIPEVLCNLVGAQAAKRGILKVFDALQNPVYNKQLFYELLEILMMEFFPEIKQLKIHTPITSIQTSQHSSGVSGSGGGGGGGASSNSGTGITGSSANISVSTNKSQNNNQNDKYPLDKHNTHHSSDKHSNNHHHHHHHQHHLTTGK